MIIKGFLCIIWLILIPIILGSIVTMRMEKYKNSIILSWILGYIMEFGIFELLSVPISLFTYYFEPILYSWILIVVAISIISIKLNYKRIKEIMHSNIDTLKKLPIAITLISVILVAVQTYIPFRYMHLDDDDSNFVAKATVTYETNTVYKYSDIGEEKAVKDLRHELATFPIYTALISKLIQIPPVITAHTIFPVIFIPMAYGIYMLIAKNLFDNDNKKVATFIIFMSILHIWGYYSVYTNFVFLLYRIWQGKAILSSIAIPLLWLLYLEYIKSERENVYWIAIIIIMMGSVLLTSMSVPIMSIALFALTLAFFKKENIVKDMLKSAVSVLPCVICGILFLILK